MTYDQARKDHEYLWQTYAAAADMTGSYVDQHDLDQLLKSPTKATARACYERQIEYWFYIGPDASGHGDERWKTDPFVWDIAERHCCEDGYVNLGGTSPPAEQEAYRLAYNDEGLRRCGVR